MGKLLVIVGVLLSFATAMVIFFTRSTGSLRENMQRNAAQEPRLLLEEFTLMRYKGFEVVSSLSADTGYFFEPNHVVLNGNIVANRQGKDSPETISAAKADAYFETTSLSNLASGSKLSRVEIENDVALQVREHTLYTEKAEYIENKRTVNSKRPVRVVGNHRKFEGDSGFNYEVDREILTMSGLVKGELSSNASK